MKVYFDRQSSMFVINLSIYETYSLISEVEKYTAKIALKVLDEIVQQLHTLLKSRGQYGR